MLLPTSEQRARWPAVRTWGSPPAPRFGKLPAACLSAQVSRFPNGSATTKEKGSASPLSTSRLPSLTNRQNPAFTFQRHCLSPAQQGALRPGSHSLALVQAQATRCSVSDRKGPSLFTGAQSSSPSTYFHFFLLSSLFYLVSSSSF